MAKVQVQLSDILPLKNSLSVVFLAFLAEMCKNDPPDAMLRNFEVFFLRPM
jgi:hypothetical protein